jgi:hypothetical protein
METVLGLDGLAIIAEVAIGLAGFSGVMIVLTRTGGGFNPPERFRLQVLMYSSVGPIFLALIPFAVLDSDWSQETSWRVLGFVVAAYGFVGLVSFPPTSFRLRREYPEIFPLQLIVTQVVLHVAIVALALVLGLGMTGHALAVYTAVLILLLLHGAIAFIRLLFFRRHEPDT